MARRLRRPQMAALALLAAMVAPLAGCWPFSGPTATCGHAPCPPPVLRLPVPGITGIGTLDPPDATDPWNVQFVEMVFPGLVALDASQRVIPWAAQSLPTVSADGLTWTFTLRRGLRWSDGAPITSATYAYAINRAENPCGASGAYAFPTAYYLYAIKDAQIFNAETCDQGNDTVIGPIQTLIGGSLTTPDPLTLRIQLAAPAAYFLAAMTYPASYAVPQQLIQTYGAKYTDHLAGGAGFGGDMYRVALWDHQGHLVLIRNATFWGARPSVREVDVTFYRSPADAYAAFQAGRADVGYAPPDQLGLARKDKTFYQVPIAEIDYYAMNWQMAPFNDVRMRQAFAIALDKTMLANTILRGAVKATNHIIPAGAPGYNPNLLGPDGTQHLSGNTALANRLATEYATSTGCGAATDFSRCPPVHLSLITGSIDEENEASAAVQMWLKAMPNYPITIVPPRDDSHPPGTGPSWAGLQFWALEWIQDYPDPQDWLSTNLSCASPYNTGHACLDVADAVMAAADADPNQAGRLQSYQEVEQWLVTAVAWLPLDQHTVWWETQPYVHGFTIGADGLVPRAVWLTATIGPS